MKKRRSTLYTLKGPLVCPHCGKKVTPPPWREDQWPDVIMAVDKHCGAPLVWQKGKMRIITSADREDLGPEAWDKIRNFVMAWEARNQ